MKLNLTDSIGILAEGDINSLTVISKDVRYQVGEILIINYEHSKEMYLFRVMNYENILRNVPDLGMVAANFLKNRSAYIARVETEKLVKVHGLLMGYSEFDANTSTWKFRKPRSLPPHFSDVYRGSENKEALLQLLHEEFGSDVEVGKLLVGTKTLDIPVCIDLESLPMHIQVAGTTGAGKSYFMMTFITSSLKNNLKKWIKGRDVNEKVSVFMVDVHDEYMRGMQLDKERWGIKNIADASLKAGNDIFDSIFGEKFYLTQELASVDKDMQKYAKEIRFRKEDLMVSDITSVMTVTDQMSGFMYWMSGQENDWITGIENLSEEDDIPYTKGTISAVKRRLYSVTHSQVFTKAETSDLAEIIYNLEKGHFYNFNSALLSSHQQFLVLTMLARTLFACRQALMSSTMWSQFEKQLYTRLPSKIANELLGKSPSCKYSIKDLYTLDKEGNDYRMKKVFDLPRIILTIEEAPTILGSQMSKEGNVFIDISRQGRKFGIGMLLITQNISAMEPTILANTNTEINMMLGNNIEIQQAIINASNNITGYEQEFKVLSRGEAIITNSLRNIPLPVKISNVPYYIRNSLPFFENPHEQLKIKKEKQITDDTPLL